MKNLLPAIAGMAAVATLSGCSSMTAPALRHETGETLGQGHYRFQGRLETSRMYAMVDPASNVIGVVQDKNVFQGSLLGVQGAYGLLPQLDFSLGTFFTVAGGGWRVAAKYQIGGKNRFAVSALVGYGAYSGSGDILYAGPLGSEKISETLAARVWEFSLPVSYRVTQSFIPYAGLNFYRAGISGSSGGAAVSDATGDFGMNLGLRYQWTQVYTDLEMACVSLHDPFASGNRLVPFFGFAVGLSF